jgi:hypothetical protein
MRFFSKIIIANYDKKMSKITLQCVKEKSKLRIKFFSFTDTEGKVYTNVYNNNLNCKFPKDVRQDGYFYEIGPDDIVLVSRPNTQAFYQIKTTNMKIVQKLDISSLQIYEITECVVCMVENSTEILVPCGHLCMCKSCCESLLKCRSNCPICRREVQSVVSEK